MEHGKCRKMVVCCNERSYSRRPRRPPFRRVLSVGMGVQSSIEYYCQ